MRAHIEVFLFLHKTDLLLLFDRTVDNPAASQQSFMTSKNKLKFGKDN
jgi:hypothetical protein